MTVNCISRLVNPLERRECDDGKKMIADNVFWKAAVIATAALCLKHRLLFCTWFAFRSMEFIASARTGYSSSFTTLQPALYLKQKRTDFK